MANITCPLPGKILEVKVEIGQQVSEGQELLTIESMKMEMPIVSTASGTVKAIHVKPGQAVQGETVLVEIQ